MTKALVNEIATFSQMPGTWKWIPCSSDWAVMPADAEALEAVEHMNDTISRRKAHVVIEVAAKSGKSTFLEMPDTRCGKVWKWKETGRTTKAQMMRRLKNVYAGVVEVEW